MQISKITFVFIAMAACAAVTARAQDNPDQAAARAAMAQKLFDLSAQSPATNVAPAAPAASVAPVAVAPAPVKKAKAKAAAPKPVELKAETSAPSAPMSASVAPATSGDNPAQAAARAALAQKLFEVSSPSTPAANVPEPKSVPAAQPAVKVENAAVAAKIETATPTQSSVAPTTLGDNPAQAAARAALAQKLFEITPSAPAVAPTTSGATALPVAQVQPKAEAVTAKPAAAPVSISPKPAPASYPGKDLGLQPITGPALPVPPAKLEKLQALLLKYKADQVTPEEYQQQRAAILAAP